MLGYPRSLPKGSELTKESLSWTLRDFEPKHDIYFQVTPFINQTETKALLEKAHKRTPHDPQLADYLAKYLEADGQTDQQQKLYEDLLKAWHGRVALWGPGSEDQQRLTGSRQIFSLIRRLTGAYGKSPAPKPEKLASSIEQIMLKIQQQMKLARPDDRFAKLFRPQIDEVLDWCRRQRT